jgi:Cu(I)/Ag(I) efflux system membrane fusion protein
MKYLLLMSLLLSIINAKEATVEQLFNVQSVKVKDASHVKSIKSYGFVKADESRIYDISPRFSGFVEILYADKSYKKIKKGEALAKVYSPEVLKAKDDYLNSLNYSNTKTSKAMLRSSKTKLELLNIPHVEIKDITDNKKSSPFTTIVSPAEGYLFKKSLNNNSAFNAKDTIFKIVSLDKVWVELKIHQNQLSFIDKVKEFKLTSPSFKESFVATKPELYPELYQKDESFTLRVEVDNKDLLLRPGMYINATMSLDTNNYLTLPATAVIRKNGKFFVFGGRRV